MLGIETGNTVLFFIYVGISSKILVMSGDNEDEDDIAFNKHHKNQCLTCFKIFSCTN